MTEKAFTEKASPRARKIIEAVRAGCPQFEFSKYRPRMADAFFEFDVDDKSKTVRLILSLNSEENGLVVYSYNDALLFRASFDGDDTAIIIAAANAACL